MIIDDFFLRWNNRKLDTDGFPKKQPYQCVDVTNQYNKDVIKGSPWTGNAIDRWSNFDPNFYVKIPRTVFQLPQRGDIVVWGTGIGPEGHIAVATGQSNPLSFVSFDQNFPLLSPCHFQKHNYQSVLGYLRPNALTMDERMELNSYRALIKDFKLGKVNEFLMPNGTILQLLAYSSYDDYLTMDNDPKNLIKVDEDFIKEVFNLQIK